MTRKTVDIGVDGAAERCEESLATGVGTVISGQLDEN